MQDEFLGGRPLGRGKRIYTRERAGEHWGPIPPPSTHYLNLYTQQIQIPLGLSRSLRYNPTLFCVKCIITETSGDRALELGVLGLVNDPYPAPTE